MRILFLYAILLFLCLGCTKSNPADRDTEVPVITITSPLDNQSFVDGQTVTIAGSVTDNKVIAEIHILVSDLTTGQIYVHVHLYPNAGFSNYTQNFTVASGINYKVEIIALDRTLNQAVKSVQVTCF